jgi:hypothetical protein
MPHLVGRSRVGRTLQPGGEPLATMDVTALRVRVELARSHIFDHTLTQRADSVSLAHGELHSELRLTAPRFSGRGSPALLRSSQPATGLSALAPAQRAGAQRLRALAHRDVSLRRGIWSLSDDCGLDLQWGLSWYGQDRGGRRTRTRRVVCRWPLENHRPPGASLAQFQI